MSKSNHKKKKQKMEFQPRTPDPTASTSKKGKRITSPHRKMPQTLIQYRPQRIPTPQHQRR